MKSAIDEKYDLLHKSPALIVDKMNRVADAVVRHRSADHEVDDLARTLGQTMALADALGRRRVCMEHDKLAKSSGQRMQAFHDGYQGIVMLDSFVYFNQTPLSPDSFTEAFDDLLAREPRIAKHADDMRRVYATGGFAVRGLPKGLAEDAKLKLTERIQKAVAMLGQKGVSSPDAGKVLAEIGDFTQAYGENVYRTNLATSYTAGRFKQMEDEDIRSITPAFAFEAVGDSSTRPNHAAGSGVTAAIDSRVWNRQSPPQGFQCRCDLRVVDVFELKERGLWKNGKVQTWYPAGYAQAHPDPGFKVERTDRRIYGS